MDKIINKELNEPNNVTCSGQELINDCDITGIIILLYLLALFVSYFAIVIYLNIPSKSHKIKNKKSQLSNTVSLSSSKLRNPESSRGRIKKITQRRTRKRLNKKE